MLIDWFTVGAQTLNFLILVWLLKHFLYQPVLDAISAREQLIAKALADAAAKQAAAVLERDEFTRQNAEFAQQRAARLVKLDGEVKAKSERLLGEARHEADNLSARLREALLGERQAMSEGIERGIRAEVMAIARKTLTDLATTSLEDGIVSTFIGRLPVMSGSNKAILESACKMSAAITVRSAFALTPAQRSAIEKAAGDFAGTAVRFQFEVAPNLICGIELVADGQKLAWSVADYLTALEKDIEALLQPRSKPQPPPVPEPGSPTRPEPTRPSPLPDTESTATP